MRVTNALIVNRVNRNLLKQQEQLYRAQRTVATGKKILQPSDDPVGMGSILNYRTTLSKVDKYQNNIAHGTTRLNITEQVFEQIDQLLARARAVSHRNHTLSSSVGVVAESGDALNHEITATLVNPEDVTRSVPNFEVAYDSGSISWSVVNGLVEYPNAQISGDANGFGIDLNNDGSDDITAVTDGALTGDAGAVFDVSASNVLDAEEVKNIYDQIISLGNTKYLDSYLFAGHQTDTAPFSRDDQYQATYAGDTGEVNLIVGDSKEIKINAHGQEVFDNGVDVFNVLKDLIDGLEENDIAKINAQTVRIDSARTQVNNVRVEMVPKIHQLDLSDKYWTNLKNNVEDRLEATESADMTSAIIELQQIETGYQTSLAAAARAIQPTLLQFLR